MRFWDSIVYEISGIGIVYEISGIGIVYEISGIGAWHLSVLAVTNNGLVC